MDAKGPINPPSQYTSYIHVIINVFSHFVVTVRIKSNYAKTAVTIFSHQWITNFGLPIYLVTDRGSDYINKDMAHLCALMGIRHSPRTAYSPFSPWLNGLVEVQNRNLGPHLRISTTLLKTENSKSMWMLPATIHNLFQNSMFLLVKLFYTHAQEFHSPLI